MICFPQSRKKEFLSSHFFYTDYVFPECCTRRFCNNSFVVKTMKFNRFRNRKGFFFHVSFKLAWLKREIKIFLLINYSWKKILFFNISGVNCLNIFEICMHFINNEKKSFTISLLAILSFFILHIHLAIDTMNVFYRSEYKHKNFCFINDTAEL